MTKRYFITDVHANVQALRQLPNLPHFEEASLHFGGDYSDGYQLEPGATLETWLTIKGYVESGKATAILGNHDDFITKAVFQPFATNHWYANPGAMRTTLENPTQLYTLTSKGIRALCTPSFTSSDISMW